MSLVVNGPAQIPLWMEALDGNSSDKTSFHEIISQVNEFTSQLAIKTPCKWVADSALCNKKKLLSCDYLCLTRVPENINEAKALGQADTRTIDCKARENGYKTCSYSSYVGDCEQRWMLVYSQKAYQRESAKFEKKLIKQAGELDMKLRRLENERFNFQSDAEKALNEINKSQRYFRVKTEIQLMKRYVSKGRPTENSETKIIEYQILTQVERDESAIENALNSNGRFVLAINDIEEEVCPDELMLKEYKEQQDVERGFRFLKDTWFMVDTIYLKSPRRMAALMMVMTLCLLVYNIAQYKLINTLVEEDETLPNQKKKPIQNPTLRWIFQLMEGVCAVSIPSNQIEGRHTIHI